MHHVSFVLSEFLMSRSVIGYIFLPCSPWHVGMDCSNLVVESRDEILFKEGRL
jgi:ornithine carbamoyltransferase